jgi:hypothetical protein
MRTMGTMVEITDACSGTGSIVNIGMSSRPLNLFRALDMPVGVPCSNARFPRERSLWLVPDPGRLTPTLTYTGQGLEAMPRIFLTFMPKKSKPSPIHRAIEQLIMENHEVYMHKGIATLMGGAIGVTWKLTCSSARRLTAWRSSRRERQRSKSSKR